MTGDWRLWLFVACVFACLWVFWCFLNFTFDLIEQAHERLREQAEVAQNLEDAKATKGLGSSVMQQLSSSSQHSQEQP